MKVAIDATALSRHASGARTRVIELYRRIACFDQVDLVLWVASDAGLKAEFKQSAAQIVEIAQPPKAWQRAFVLLNQAARNTNRSSEFDLFCAEAIPVPRMTQKPLTVTLHDLRFLNQRYASWLRRLFARTLLLKNLIRARAIVTVSQVIQQELMQAFPLLTPSKIHLVPNSVPPMLNLSPMQSASILRNLEIDQPYFLCLGHLEPRKNLHTLVQGFAHFKQVNAKAGALRLVIAGRSQGGITQEKVAHWANRSGCRCPDELILTGPVSDQERVALLSQSMGVVQPSCYEGFGLGVLEALALGIPTVCSRIPAHQEVAVEDAVYFAPHDPQDLSRALARTAFDDSIRKALMQRGPQAARRFSWDRSAKRLVQLWQDILTYGN